MNSDAFLGAVATAAAALVAIVGGLLVARVISLATERSGLAQRVSDLGASLENARARHDELDARLLVSDLEDVEDDVIDKFIDEEPVNPAEVQARVAPHRSVEQVAQRVRDTAVRVAAIREVLVQAWTEEGYIYGRRVDYTDRNHIAVSDGDEYIWNGIWRRIKEVTPKPRAKNNPWGFAIDAADFDPSLLIPEVGAIRSAAQSAQLAALRRDVDEAHHRVTVLETELAQSRVALSRVAHPRGVAGGLTVLVGVIVTGVLVPLALMAGNVSLSVLQRFGVLVLFALGLAALVIYLVIETRRLAAPNGSAAL